MQKMKQKRLFPMRNSHPCFKNFIAFHPQHRYLVSKFVMSIYLNEYNPNSKSPANSVTAESQKIRFNNIQTCVGVVVHDFGRGRMIGVHLTTMSTFNKDEMAGVVNKINALTGNTKNKIYLVYASRHQVKSHLLSSLRPIASQLLGCQIETSEKLGADVDVNVKLENGAVGIWLREHADISKDASGKAMIKDKYAGNKELTSAALAKGKHVYQTDKEGKPWMQVPAIPI